MRTNFLNLTHQKQLKKCLLSFLFLFISSGFFAQVGIGLENPAPYSALEIKTNHQGVRLPQLTNQQRDQLDAIVVPPSYPASNKNGLMIYNVDSQCVEVWISSKWMDLVCYSN